MTLFEVGIFIGGVILISLIIKMHIVMLWRNVMIFKLLGSPADISELPTQDNIIEAIVESRNKGKKKDDEKKKPQKSSMGNPFEPFVELFGGVKDLFGPLKNVQLNPFKGSQEQFKKELLKENEKAALGAIKTPMVKTYENFKKAHGMLAW